MRPDAFDWLVQILVSANYHIHELVFGTFTENQSRIATRIASWAERVRAIDPDAYIIVNCDTLQPHHYQTLRSAGADAVWTFIEVMDPAVYSAKHVSGLKADRAQRLEAPYRIRDAGLAVGNALLWGLHPAWEEELEAFTTWAASVGGFDWVATPVQQDVPLRPGARVPLNFDVTPPLRIDTGLYLEICARLRLAFPETRLVANTRLDPSFVYGEVSEIADTCNGYVWTGARSHPELSLAPTGHVHNDSTQMEFFNPGLSLQDIEALCPDQMTVLSMVG